MKNQKGINPNDTLAAAKRQGGISIKEYLSRFPKEDFPDEFKDLQKRLSALNLEELDESQFFPISKKTGNGIYIEGPKVMVKNIKSAQGHYETYDFYIDDVLSITHYAKFIFMFLVIGFSMERASAVVLINTKMEYIGAIHIQSISRKELRRFLSYLVLANPRIMADEYILKFISGSSGVFSNRMTKKVFIALFGNIIFYVILGLILVWTDVI